MPLSQDVEPAPLAAPNAPGSTISALDEPKDLDDPAQNVGPVLTVKLGSREDCIGTLERIGRAILAGRIKGDMARQLTQVCRVALETFSIISQAGRRKGSSTAACRASTGAKEAERAIRDNPDNEPDPIAEPEPTPALTFEERVMGAREAERKAAERAAGRP